MPQGLGGNGVRVGGAELGEFVAVGVGPLLGALSAGTEIGAQFLSFAGGVGAGPGEHLGGVGPYPLGFGRCGGLGVRCRLPDLVAFGFGAADFESASARAWAMAASRSALASAIRASASASALATAASRAASSASGTPTTAAERPRLPPCPYAPRRAETGYNRRPGVVATDVITPRHRNTALLVAGCYFMEMLDGTNSID